MNSTIVLRSGRILGNDSRKPVNIQEKLVVPGKRSNRLFSVPVQKKSVTFVPSKEKSIVTPAKRIRRLNSTPNVGSPNLSKEKGNITPSKRTSQQAKSVLDAEDPFSKIVALNCKLTNEILLAKKQLFDRTDTLFKVQDNLHHKEIECIQLKAQVKDLEKIIEQMRPEQLPSDLIEADTQTSNPAQNFDGVDLNDNLTAGEIGETSSSNFNESSGIMYNAKETNSTGKGITQSTNGNRIGHCNIKVLFVDKQNGIQNLNETNGENSQVTSNGFVWTPID